MDCTGEQVAAIQKRLLSQEAVEAKTTAAHFFILLTKCAPLPIVVDDRPVGTLERSQD
jgi:hypothetical protein